VRRLLFLVPLLWLASPAAASSPPCNAGLVWEDRNGNGLRDADEPGLPDVKVSDGVDVVRTDADGRYRLPVVDGRSVFVIKPAGYVAARRADGLPDLWRHIRTAAGPDLRYGGIPVEAPGCRDFALRAARPSPNRQQRLDVLLLADPQAKSLQDVDYYRRDIIDSIKRDAAIDMGHRFGGFYFDGLAGDLGLSLGDIADDDLSLYPALTAATTRLGVPWLHAAGNHDIDLDAANDEDSLLTFRRHYGPDTHAWEEPEAIFVLLDDVIHQPGTKPAYVGGLREDQFAFLQAYLPTVDRQRLLVVGAHMPFFGSDFRAADRARLFALLRDFPHVLLLSGHTHTQRHWYHDAATGWHGARPLHEYNVGAACGAFWSGVRDADGIPDATMADGTPNGYARLAVSSGGRYALSWHAARDPDDTGIGLHAPKVLRQGAYPAWGVYANVYMGDDDTRVEYRIDGGEWKPMKRVEQPDPRVLRENLRDDTAEALRGFDRLPEAKPSAHLWRGALPTDLAEGEHRIDVRAFDRWRGELRARTGYRLEQASP